MKSAALHLLTATLICASAAARIAHAVQTGAVQTGAAQTGHDRVRAVADGAIPTLMKQHGIPGMAVGIITPDGHHLFDYGVASKETGEPVTARTLFEIGSISKTFTATLASYAAVRKNLSLADSVGDHIPALKGSALGEVSLLDLGIHTPGGMPLQFPDAVTDEQSMMAYFKAWQPSYEPGTHRTYANPSIGLLGVVAADSMSGDFVALMQDGLYPALGLEDTYLDPPEAARGNYAQGYGRNGKPTRMSPGVLASEAYGVRTTAADLVRFLEANMGRIDLEEDLRQAITDTHTGYYKLGPMTQGLIWEQYDYPVPLKDLVAGNSPQIGQKPKPVTAITPPQAPRRDVLINKTGSTFGFGAYVAFVPEREIGIVLLANRNYPNDARVTAAHAILRELGDAAPPSD
jgi:beta-lactamase class C